MKINKIFLASILLLAIMTIGVASAADNPANLTASDTGDIAIESPADDEIVADGFDEAIIGDEELEGSGAYISSHAEGYIKGDTEAEFSLYIPQEVVDGNIYVYLDSLDNNVYQKSAESWDNEIRYYDLIGESVEFGNHTIFVEYKESSMYLPFSDNFTIDYDYYRMDISENMTLGPYHYNAIRVFFAEDITGDFIFKIDDDVVVDSREDGIDYSYWISLTKCACGNHTWSAEYKNGNYPAFSESGIFLLDYYYEASTEWGEWAVEYGDDFVFNINAPSTLQSIVIEYNGKSRTVPLEDGEATVTISDYEFGEQNITLKVLKNEQFYASEKTYELNVTAKCDVPYIRYNTNDSLFFKLPSDANGTLFVTVDDDDSVGVELKDGEAKFLLSNYTLEYHELAVSYDDGKYLYSMETGFEVNPNIKYEKYMVNGSVNKVSIELPEGSNGTFTVSCYDRYEFFDTAEIVNGSAEITLDDFTYDDESEPISLDWECDGDYTFYGSIDIYPIFFPSNTTITVTGSLTMIKDSYNTIHAEVNPQAKGYINISIDGKYADSIGLDYGYVDIEFYDLCGDLALGNHTVKLEYSGDDYFEPSSKEFTIKVVPLSINIPNPYILGGSTIYIRLPSSNPDGYAVVYVNGTKYTKGEVRYHEGGPYISIQLDGLKLNSTYDIKVVYTGDSKIPEMEKSAVINTDYSIDIYGNGEYNFGSDVDVEVYLSIPMKGNVTLKAENNTYTLPVDDYEVVFKIPGLDIGTHKLTATFDGQGIISHSASCNVTVLPYITFDGGNIVDGAHASLTLPAGANGSLYAEILDEDDNVIANATEPLKDGKANMTLKTSKLGHYYCRVSYTGDDYDIEPASFDWGVTPKIAYKDSVYVGEENPLTFEMPSDANGNLTIKYCGKNIPCEFKDGKCSVTLPAIDHETEAPLDITYSDEVYGNYGYGYDEFYEVYVYVNLLDPHMNVTAPSEITAGNPADFVFTLPKDAKGVVRIELLSDYYRADVSNGKATVSITFSDQGKYTLYCYYGGEDANYASEGLILKVDVGPKPTITAKDATVVYSAGTYYKVQVFDGYGKAVGAGESVTFYINNKKVSTAKTDKNGYASYKVTQTPNTYKIKATYKGASAIKKLTVKHIVTLKKVTVKRSAKKLVITATLSKVNKKYLKNKKVTFKFNGKKYTAKTNKKGVAKVTIKSSVLKKLKASKKVTYQATYLKDTVKQTVNVKK